MEASSHLNESGQTIPHRQTTTPVPASFAQQRMWFLEQLDGDNAVYNQLNALMIRGPLDVGSLRQSLDSVIRRHEALRTNLYVENGQVYQSISELKALHLPIVDLSGMSSETMMAEAERRAVEEAKKPFDLKNEPLVRVLLFKLSDGEHMLSFVTHHAIFDGWSVNLLRTELAALYGASIGREPEPTQPLLQYTDYALWQRERYESGDFDGQLKYWQDKLSGKIPLLELPTDHPRPTVQSFNGTVYTRVIPSPLADTLKALARSERATLFMVLLASYNAFLYRYTGQEDLIVGCPIAGRHYRELEDLVGLFVNTLPMRNLVSGEMTFIELIRQVRKTAFEAYGNQDMPFDKLVEKLSLDRQPSRTPVFQTLFQMRNFPDRLAERSDITFERHYFNYTTAKVDLTLEITETRSGLSCRFVYPTALFDDQTIARMADHWVTLLQSISMDPGQPVGRLQLLTPDETRNILYRWNDTKADYPRESTVHHLFEERAKALPGTVVIIHDDRQVTYRELNSRANKLARYLLAMGIRAGDAVAVCMERSIELVACELAILKVGSVYVPIDPANPPERIAFMINDVHAGVLLAMRLIPDLDGLGPCHIVYLEEEQGTIGHQDDGDLAVAVDARDTAYIMYTSGSTGQPKGVRVTHRAINRLVINTNYFTAGPGDAMAHISNPAFDAATFEVWGALLNGARLVIYDKNTILSPAEFSARIQKDDISTMFMTAQLFSLFAREAPGAFKAVRDMLVGGEAIDRLSAKIVMEHDPPKRLINAYGPTENTTFSICYHIKDLDFEDGIPIGKPISNSTAYILDTYHQPVQVGVIGEIYLGGDGVAEGYHERPDLNKAAFIPDPFIPEPGRMLYRTGDLGCFMPDGNIRYKGRRDTQVKIRGFRVEPDEVTAVLSTYPSVSTALVTMKEVNGEKRLIAYLLSRYDEIDIDGLREYARKKLPEYMVPSYFIILEEFPLTSAGKIDHRSLPLPGDGDGDRQVIYERPRDELEQTLAGIWVEVLGVNSINIDDNFFDIGGHSLAAVQMFAKVEADIGVKLPISMIFTSPTIRLIAQAIRENNKSHLWQCLVPLKPEGIGPSLFCVHTVSCMLGEYNSLVKCLNIRHSIYGIQPVGLDGSDPPLESIETMAARYVKEICIFQPQGPYLLMGYSSGGIIAYEMARQLRAQGLEVSLLCLIEPYLSNRNYYSIKHAISVQSLKTLAGGSITVLMHLMGLKTSRALIMPPMMGNATTIIPYQISKALGLHTPVRWIYPDWALTMPEPRRQVALRNYEAFIRYFPGKHTGSAVLFVSQSMVDGYNGTAMGWEKLVGEKLEVINVPGDHTSMVEPPNVEVLARYIEYQLDKALYECPIKPSLRVKESDKR